MALTDYRYLDRGPTSSADYNKRVRDTIDAFLELNGRVAIVEGELQAITTLTTLEQVAMTGTFDAIRQDLEVAQQASSFASPTKIVTLFGDKVHRTVTLTPSEPTDSSSTLTDPLSWEPEVGNVVLPYSTRVSKLTYGTTSGTQVDPEVMVTWTHTDPEVNTNANEPLRAIDGRDSTAFLVRSNAVSGTKTLTFYVTVPPDSAQGASVNYLELIPAPINATQLYSIQYSDEVGAILDESTTWKNLFYHIDTGPGAGADTRYKAPQSDGTNAQQNCGLRRYYFGERNITALKIVLKTNADIDIGEGPERVLGIRRLDVGHVSWGSSGHLVFNIHLPVAVRSVTDVRPRLINRGSSTDGIDGVGTYEPEVVLYRNIGTQDSPSWQVYAEGVDVGAGNEFQNFRVELGLRLAANGCTPQVAGFEVEYSTTG